VAASGRGEKRDEHPHCRRDTTRAIAAYAPSAPDHKRANHAGAVLRGGRLLGEYEFGDHRRIDAERSGRDPTIRSHPGAELAHDVRQVAIVGAIDDAASAEVLQEASRASSCIPALLAPLARARTRVKVCNELHHDASIGGLQADASTLAPLAEVPCG